MTAPDDFGLPLDRWILSHRRDDDPAGFMRAVVVRLRAAGVPLWRARYALMTTHPEVLWRSIQWCSPGETEIVDQPHARLEESFYTTSPVAEVRRSHAPVRVRLTPGELPYPICRILRDEGATDYYVVPLPFTNGQVSYASFATNEDAGFSDAALAILESIRPFLACKIELESAYYASRTLLDIYLGKNAARRVFAGDVRREKGELIEAAIWFSDMRDFTALTDRIPAAQVIGILDVYFDAVASAVAEHGGEVLKFIGDAVLAIFPVAGDARAACAHALAAADQAFAALDQLNDDRAARGEDSIAIGVALHRGSVMYGNIGARDRLDFTVISSSVNEASRLESLSKSLGTPLVLSAAFTEAAQVVDAIDLGEHELKGVKAKQRVFTVKRAPRAPNV